MRTITRVVIGSAVLALAVTACGGGGGSGNGGDGSAKKSFSVGINEPADLVPGNTNESEGAAVDNVLFNGLTTYDVKTGKAVNLVAKSVTSTDSKNWTIKLNPGWTFHNGEKVTAKSFSGAWDLYVYKAMGNTYFFTDLLAVKGAGAVAKKKAKHMSGVKTVGTDTIKVSLDAPNSDFPLIIGYTAFYPMPESVIKSGDTKAYKEKPIGNGPYQMVGSWKHNQSIQVKKFANYAGPNKGKADNITFKIYSSPDTEYNDVVAGDLDVQRSVPPSKLATAKSQFGDRYQEADSSSFTYLGFPTYDKNYKNAKVRQAFSMAIDRDVIIKKLFNGTLTPAKSLVTPLIKLGFRDDACGTPCEYNPTKAKAMLKAAGGFKGDTVTFWYNTGSGNDEWVKAVANQIKANLGLKVKLKGQAWAQYLDTTNAHKQDGPYRLGWIMDYPGPSDYICPIYGTNGSSNGSGYSNKLVDKSCKQGAAAKTAEDAVQYYHAAEGQILKDMPIIPLWFGKNISVNSDKVTGLTYDATGALRIDQIQVK